MALVRLALRNLEQKFSPTLISQYCEKGLVGNRHNQRTLNRCMATSAGEIDDIDEIYFQIFLLRTCGIGQEQKKNTEVSVSEKKSPRRNFPRRRGRKSLWRNTDDPQNLFFAKTLFRVRRIAVAPLGPPTPPSPDPPPPKNTTELASLVGVASMIQDRVKIFLAVLIRISLFFWASALEGRGRVMVKARIVHVSNSTDWMVMMIESTN